VRNPNEEIRELQRLRTGDERACEAWVRAHAGRVLAVTRRILRSEQDAQDAAQLAFLCAFRSIHRFRGGSSLSTWLHRIAVNAALMLHRAATRRAELPLEDLLPRFAPDGHHAAPVGDWSASAEELLRRKETRRKVREAIARLPQRYRVVLVLRDLEELDTEEAAQRLGVTTMAVKLRLHRARQALRTLLAQEFERSAA
jgi:RNA polymerase sigma-70 factor (ECF subfamily)